MYCIGLTLFDYNAGNLLEMCKYDGVIANKGCKRRVFHKTGCIIYLE